MSDRKREHRQPLTHSVSYVPITRDERGNEIEGPPVEVGAVGIPAEIPGFRYVARRSTDHDLLNGGALRLRKLGAHPPERGERGNRKTDRER